jgi:hypothetical protein
MVTLQSTPVVNVVREDPAQKEYIYETEHYEFLCDSLLGANLVREFSRVFEATWLVNCLLPLDFNPQPEGNRRKFSARIFSDVADYHAAGGPPTSAGIYFPQQYQLKLPLDSLGVKKFGSSVTIDYATENYHTLIHEITHQMMNRWIGRLPIWYIEGSAEYVALAKYDSGRLSFLKQDNRMRDWLVRSSGGGKFRMVPLAKLMSLTPRQWMTAVENDPQVFRNYASAAALTYYFYHLDGDGKGTRFKEFVRAAGNLPAYADTTPLVSQYLLRGRDFKALEKDVQRGLRRIGVTVEFVE